MRLVYLPFILLLLSSCADIHVFMSGNQAISGTFKKIDQLSSGREASCFLSEGDVYCWGNNIFGSLGLGHSAATPVPQKVQGIPSGKVTMLSRQTAHYHQCAIAGVEVYCWGINRDGSIGTQTALLSEVPTAVKVIGIDGLTPTHVATGKYNTCIVFGDVVKCAGWNYASALGRGPVPGDLTVLTDVAGLPGLEVVDIRKGEHNTCVQLVNGSLWCWGDGVLGGLGTGNSTHQHTAQEIFPDKVSALTYSNAFGCVIREGRVYCWGTSSTNQIPGNAAVNASPVEITGFPDEVIDIEVAESTICAVLKNSTIYCWGGVNPYLLGRETIGDNSTPQRNFNIPATDNIHQWGSGFCSKTSQGYICWGSNEFWSLNETIEYPKYLNEVPPAVGLSLNNSKAEGASGSSACINTALGDVYCWGWGYFDGTAIRSSLSVPTKISSLSNVTKILAVGNASHYCALLGNGNVTCYGTGSNGRLGNGLTTVQALPQSTYSGNDATDLSCSGASCCMVHAGQISCWGLNTNGNLGDGTTTQRLVPTLNSSGRTDFSKIHMNGNTSCAQTSAGEVYCWGSVALGINPSVACGAAYCSTPQLVTLPNPVSKLQVGEGYTCALSTLKELWCWGSNTSGQLGQGDFFDSFTPVKVSALFDIDDFWITSKTTYVKANNKIYCLGNNESFNCGVLTTENFSIPFETSLPASSIEFGQSNLMNCSLMNDGKVMCWGNGGRFHGNLLNSVKGIYIPKKMQFSI